MLLVMKCEDASGDPAQVWTRFMPILHGRAALPDMDLLTLGAENNLLQDKNLNQAPNFSQLIPEGVLFVGLIFLVQGIKPRPFRCWASAVVLTKLVSVLCSILYFERFSLNCPNWPWTHTIAQTGLGIEILLLSFPSNWDYKPISPGLVLISVYVDRIAGWYRVQPWFH